MKLLCRHFWSDTSFVRLPRGLFQSSRQGNLPLVLQWQPEAGQVPLRAFVGWAGEHSAPDPSSPQVIEIPAALAESLGGIPEGQWVEVEAAPLADAECLASLLQLEPVSVDDWEVLERNPGLVEENLLSQINIVTLGAEFPLWVEGTRIHFRAVSAEPQHLNQYGFAKLTVNSQISIAPLRRSAPQGSGECSSVCDAQFLYSFSFNLLNI